MQLYADSVTGFIRFFVREIRLMIFFFVISSKMVFVCKVASSVIASFIVILIKRDVVTRFFVLMRLIVIVVFLVLMANFVQVPVRTEVMPAGVSRVILCSFVVTINFLDLHLMY